MSNLMIETQDVIKDFDQGGRRLRILKGITLEVPAGQFLTIMGPSGSGKSTLMYLLGGLDRTTAGDIRVAGYDLEQLSNEALAEFRRDTVGFVFQSYYLVPTLNVLENAALPGIFAGMAREEREERAGRLLERLEMSKRLTHRPSQLSGGQMQRVAIARALFNDPDIIMGDEPTGALDSQTGTTVLKLLRWLCDKQGKTIVLVTHDPHVADYADRVVHLRDGMVDADTLQKERAS